MTTDTTTRTPLDGTQRLLAVGLVLGVTLVAFEATAIITALPTITDDLGGDSLYGVTLATYTLANLVALVAAGRYADRNGPLPTFLISIGVFITGLLVSAIAPSMAVVVLGRALQGAGAGGFAPIAYVLVKRAFPEDRQAMMYVYLSAGWVLPSLIAPAFGGIVTEQFGWRWVFAGIIPLALAVGALASVPMRRFGPSEHEPDPADANRVLIAFGASSGVGLFIIGLRASNIVVLAIAVVAGAALAVPMLRRLLPPGVATARTGQPAVLACRFLATATFIGIDGFVPLAADRIHGASPIQQGFTIIGAALTWTGGQALVARRPDLAPAVAVRLGFFMLLLGTVLVIPVLLDGWPLWATFLGWSVGGFGMGIIYNPTTVAAMSYAGDGREGLVSSQVQLIDALGFSVMGGVGGAIIAIADRTSFALRDALLVCFCMSVACAAAGIVAARGVRRAA
ncbi:MAG: MFS transporter [Ilumatobacteraceae bacterium]